MAKAKRKATPRQTPPENGQPRDSTIPVSVASAGDGYLPDYVQAGALSISQRTNLKRLFNGLHRAHATVETASGRKKHVDSYSDVIRYLLENVE